MFSLHNHHLLSALRRQTEAISTCLVEILPIDGVKTSFMKPHTLLRAAVASSEESMIKKSVFSIPEYLQVDALLPTVSPIQQYIPSRHV